MPINTLEWGQQVTPPTRPARSQGGVPGIEESAEPGAIQRRDERSNERRQENPSGGRQGGADTYQKTSGEEWGEAGVLRAVDMMSGNPWVLKPDNRLGEARSAFRKHRFRYFPVVAEGRRLVGIISDRDVVRIPIDRDGERVRDFMVTRVITATPETTVREIARTLMDQRVGAMPVVDPDGRIVGMITRTDVLRALIARGQFHQEV